MNPAQIKNILKSPLFWVLFICCAISLSANIRYRWRGKAKNEVIASDGIGYYSYLPATFIYNDPTFSYYKDINRKYKDNDQNGPFMTMVDDKLLNKYYYGEALMVAPFFAGAHLYGNLFNLDNDGFAPHYQIAVGLACLFWVMIGLYYLAKYLANFVSPRTAAITSGLIYGGSNLFYYTIFEPSASHPYSFTLVACFIYFAHKSFQNNTVKSYLIVAFILSLSIAVRPSNAIVVLALPAIAGKWKTFVNWFIGAFKWRILPLAFIILGILLFPQAWFYKQQTGHWWVYAYGNEKFIFSESHFLEVLAGFRVGLITYSPIVAFAIIGLLFLIRKNKFQGFWLAGFVTFNIWLISCWWMWHYEGTFGMRPLIDHLAWWGLPLAMLLQALPKYFRQLILVIMIGIVATSNVLAYERFQAIIPWNNMNYEKFKFLFLNTDKKFGHLFTDKNFPDFPENARTVSFYSINDGQTNSHKGILLEKGKRNLLFQIPIDSVCNEDEYLHISTNLMWNFNKPHVEARIIVETISDGKAHDWNNTPLMISTPRVNDWNWFFFQYNTSDSTLKGDTLRIWIEEENESTQTWVDDLAITLAPFPKDIK